MLTLSMILYLDHVAALMLPCAVLEKLNDFIAVPALETQ